MTKIETIWNRAAQEVVKTAIFYKGAHIPVRLMPRIAAREANVGACVVNRADTLAALMREGVRVAGRQKCGVYLRLVRGPGRPNERVLVLADHAPAKPAPRRPKPVPVVAPVAARVSQSDPAVSACLNAIPIIDHSISRISRRLDVIDEFIADHARLIEGIRRALRRLQGLSATAPGLPDIPGAPNMAR